MNSRVLGNWEARGNSLLARPWNGELVRIMRRSLRHKKEIDYLLMNDQGLVGSMKTAMAEKQDNVASKSMLKTGHSR